MFGEVSPSKSKVPKYTGRKLLKIAEENGKANTGNYVDKFDNILIKNSDEMVANSTDKMFEKLKLQLLVEQGVKVSWTQ